MKAIVHDVEQREGRSFSGPEILPVHPEPRPPLRPIAPKGSYSLSKIIQEVAEREGCPVELPEAGVGADRHEGPRHPRATRQVTLEGNRAAHVVTPLDKFDLKGAGRGQTDRSSGARAGNRSAPDRDQHPGTNGGSAHPRGTSGATLGVLSLLPQLPGLSDEAFLMLYLDASREFERRFDAHGWYDRALALAARGR